MWQKGTAPGTYNWQQALSHCETLSLAGYNDWRLPDINELQSIVDYTTYGPSIDQTYFPNTASESHYWSSTTYDSELATVPPVPPVIVLGFRFYTGYTLGYHKFGTIFVRAVRSGQTGSFEDSDGDGFLDDEDNCPNDYNPDQENSDFDDMGDVCDWDDDEDGELDGGDNCRITPNGPNKGTCFNYSHFGDPCVENTDCGDDGFCSMNTEDRDTDGFGDVCDNCPYVANDQSDSDNDGIGDECDPGDNLNSGISLCDKLCQPHTAWIPGPYWSLSDIRDIRRVEVTAVGSGECFGRCGIGCPGPIGGPVDCYKTNRYTQACLNHDACCEVYNLPAAICALSFPCDFFFTIASIDCHDAPECDPICLDSDLDGLPNDMEVLAGTNPFDADTDDDGLVDGNVGSEDLNANGIYEPELGETDPLNPDSDGDGRYDGMEKCLAEPETQDTDLSTGNFVAADETCTITDPNNPDTDNDTILDGDDNCPNDPDNDIDGDGVCGDVDGCSNDPDNDIDADGICGDVDNCPVVANPDQSDSDNDNMGDACDNCPESNLEGTIIIDGCDSGVDNHLFDDGCKMSDLIAECADGAKNHGKFVSCVSHLANDWKKQKLISGKEKGAIQSCAAKADIPQIQLNLFFKRQESKGGVPAFTFFYHNLPLI